jgi:hypothetical protein
MDQDTLTLIITQAITFLLLIVSEAYPFTQGPINGIIHGIVQMYLPALMPKDSFPK